MKTISFIISALALLCLPAAARKTGETTAPDPNFHIYLCFGQSNMEGNAAIEDQDRKGVDPRFVAMYAVDDEKAGWKKGEWHTAVPPQARPNTGLSPVDYFGRQMVANLPDSIRVGTITVAVGGASIDLFNKRTCKAYLKKQPDWMKDFASKYNGNPYARLIEMAKIAKQQGVIKGILLHQGETDNGSPTWAARVKTVYTDILKELNMKAEDVPLLVGETVQKDQGGSCWAHIAIVDNIAKTIPTAHVVSSKGCPQRGDGLHFVAESYRTMGKRYADKMLSLLGITPSTDSFQNPMLWADVPDVDVIRDGDNFYMVSTTMHLMPGAPIMKSKDLVNWETVNYIFPRLTDSPKYDMQEGTAYGRGQWATSLQHHKGKFYALFAPNDSPGGETYICTADDIEGKWTIHSRMRHFHDAALFFDDDDKAYVFYGTGEMVQLNSDLTDVVEGSHRQIFQRDADETGLLEGSRVIKRDGKYYLLMISWTKGHPRRQVCYRADNLQGPWEKKVILETQFEGFNGVGQGTIVDAADGNWYGIIFQDRGGVGRVLTLEPCTWKDGWPMLGDAQGNIPLTMKKPVQGYYGKGIVYSDDFGKDKLDLQWQWNHNPIDEAWSLTERKGFLRLKTSRLAHDLFLAPNTLTNRMEGPTCEGIIKMDISQMKDGDVAGFAAFQGDAALLSIVKDGEKTYIMGFKDNVALTDKEKAVTQVLHEIVYRQPLQSDTVYLKIAADFRLHKDLATLSYSTDGKTWTPAIRDFKMVYDYRRLFMGTRFAIYNYATKQSGGYVDVDSFEYSKE